MDVGVCVWSETWLNMMYTNICSYITLHTILHTHHIHDTHTDIDTHTDLDTHTDITHQDLADHLKNPKTRTSLVTLMDQSWHTHGGVMSHT